MSWAETIYLKKFIQGEKRFAVSDSAIATLDTRSIPSANFTSQNFFSPEIDGTVRIKVTVIYNSSSNYADITFSIFEDGNMIFSRSATLNGGLGDSYEFAFDVPVAKGKKYTAQLKRTAGSANCITTPITVCGQVTDANYFNVGVNS